MLAPQVPSLSHQKSGKIKLLILRNGIAVTSSAKEIHFIRKEQQELSTYSRVVCTIEAPLASIPGMLELRFPSQSSLCLCWFGFNCHYHLQIPPGICCCCYCRIKTKVYLMSKFQVWSGHKNSNNHNGSRRNSGWSVTLVQFVVRTHFGGYRRRRR